MNRPMSSRIKNRQGWMIATSIFVLNFFFFGVMHSFSLVFVELQRDFNSTATIVGSVGSITSATISFVTPISCLLYEATTHRFVAIIGVLLCSLGILLSSFVTDVKLLILTFSIVFGSGANFLYNPLMNLISYYFPEKQSARVTSYAAAGASVGSLVLSPLIYLLMPKFGWRTVFQGYSCIILIIGLASCKPLDPPPPQTHPTSTDLRDTHSTSTDLRDTHSRTEISRKNFIKYIRILKTWEHWLFNLAIVFGASAVCFYLFYLVSVVESLNISTKRASTLVIIYSATQLLGRFFCVFLGDSLPIHRTVTLAINGAIGASSAVLLLFGDNYPLIIVFTSVLGFVTGVYFSLIYSAGIEIFGLERNSESVAYTIISIGVATLSIPLVYGVPYDVSGDYTISILNSIVVWMLSSVFFSLAILYRINSKNQSRYSGVSSVDQEHNLAENEKTL